MSIATPPPTKILIIEDNEMDAALLQETLKQAGTSRHEFARAVRLVDAMRLLDENKFDVILSDLSLPDSLVADTFKRLHAHAQETPIILLTGFEDEALGLEAVRAGAQAYIVKGTMSGKALWRAISYAIERKAMDKALRESEQRYKRLLTSVTDYIYISKVEEGRVVSTSHGPGCVRVTGYTSHDLDGDSHLWYRMVHDEDRAKVLEQAAQVIIGNPLPLEHRIIHKDGSVRWVRHTPVLRLDSHDKLIGYDGLVSDITERKQAEEALRQVVEDLQKSREELKTAHLQLMQAERLETVGRMAAGVAHEVKNPLQILLMSLDYLTQHLSGREPVLDGVLNEMGNAARRADRIIHGLLDFSASDELDLKPQDCNRLVNQGLALVRHNLASNHVNLVAQLGDELPQVPLDGDKIEQVFVNIFTNAIDAMPQGGTLTVKTRMERLTETHRDLGSRVTASLYAGDAVVIVEIEDTGSGISPEAFRKIFDPFFTTKTTGKGTGLGLAIVKRIIDLHGGEIEIVNRPEGGVRCTLLFKAVASINAQV